METEYKFIYDNINASNIKSYNKILMSNDIYTKYDATLIINGELIVNFKTNKSNNEKQVIKETYQDYLDYISIRDFSNEQWIYNIINGNSEQDSILYSNFEEELIIISSFTWNQTNINKLHILSIHSNLNKRCLRDLVSSDIQWIENALKISYQIILNKFTIKQDKIKTFIHYEPSTYQLHIHFQHIDFIDSNSSCEYSHEINSVLFNLQLDSDYYKKIDLLKCIRS